MKSKSLIIVVTALLVNMMGVLSAQEGIYSVPELAYFKQFGGNASNTITKVMTSVDSIVYITGSYADNLNMLDKEGLATMGKRQTMVSRITSSGEIVWSRSLSDFGVVSVLDMSSDTAGSIYLIARRVNRVLDSVSLRWRTLDWGYSVFSYSSVGELRWVEELRTYSGVNRINVVGNKIRLVGHDEVWTYTLDGKLIKSIKSRNGYLKDYTQLMDGEYVISNFDKSFCLADICVRLKDTCRCVNYVECFNDTCISRTDTCVCAPFETHGTAVYNLDTAAVGEGVKAEVVLRSKKSTFLSLVEGGPNLVFYDKVDVNGSWIEVGETRLAYGDNHILIIGIDSAREYDWHTLGIYEKLADLRFGKWMNGYYYFFGDYDFGKINFDPYAIEGGNHFMLILDQYGQVVSLKNTEFSVLDATLIGEKIMIVGHNERDCFIDILDALGNKEESFVSRGYGGKIGNRFVTSIDINGYTYLHGSSIGRFLLGDKILEGKGGYLARVNVEGTDVAWVKSIETSKINTSGVIDDSEGSVFFWGKYEDQLTIDSHSISTSLDAGLYCGKVNKDGDLLFLKNMESPWIYGTGALALDQDNNFVIGSNFLGGVVVDETKGFLTNGETNGIITKLSGADGSVKWTHRIPSKGSLYVNSVTSDSRDNVFSTGVFSENLSYGTHNLVNYGSWASFISKLDANGRQRWTKSISTEGGSVQANAIKSDHDDNLLVYGTLENNSRDDENLKIHIGHREIDVKSGTGSNLFLAKLTDEGELVWFRTIQSRGDSRYSDPFMRPTYNIDLDEEGGIYVGGGTLGTLMLPEGEITKTNNGTLYFAAKYNDTGSMIWLKPIYTIANAYGPLYSVHYKRGLGLLLSGGLEDIGINGVSKIGDSILSIDGDRAYLGLLKMPQEEGNTTEQLLTKINSTPIMNKLIVYPNPTTDKIYWETEYSGDVILFDSKGAIVLGKTFVSGSSELDLTTFAPGVYYLVVHRGNFHAETIVVTKR